MKKAIVIGASSGIGRELVKLLASKGFKVGIAGRRIELLKELQKQDKSSFFPVMLDVTNAKAISQLDEITSEIGGLDLLVFTAGIGYSNPNLILEIEEETIQTNITGFTAIAGWAFQYFMKQRHGHLVAITSISGLRGHGDVPAYNASKAYQINYLESLSLKAKKLRLPITVTDVRPGLVDTYMAKSEIRFWISSPQKAAKQILSAIEAKKEVVYVTKRWGIIALMLKLLPSKLYQRLCIKYL